MKPIKRLNDTHTKRHTFVMYICVCISIACKRGLYTSSKKEEEKRRWIIIWKWWLPVFVYFDFFMNVYHLIFINYVKKKKEMIKKNIWKDEKKNKTEKAERKMENERQQANMMLSMLTTSVATIS